MMIVREAFYGSTRFSEFQSRLGISRNILTKRLVKMEADGLLEKHPDPDDARASCYQLTAKGRALFAVLVALLQWGDKWATGKKGPPLAMVRRDDEAPIAPLEVRDSAGNPVRPRDVRLKVLHGADEETRQRLEALTRQS